MIASSLDISGASYSSSSSDQLILPFSLNAEKPTLNN
jgi:hypothetical protein